MHIRYDGSDTTLPVMLAPIFAAMAHDFAPKHAQLFGFGFEGRALIAESVEVEATSSPSPSRSGEGRVRVLQPRARLRHPLTQPSPRSGGEGDKLLLARRVARRRRSIARMISRVAQTVDGPALLIEPHQTIVVEPGWRAELRVSARRRACARLRARTAQYARAREADPVLLEVFANLFMAIAEEMGATLQNTATSVNIKERLDFSCAIFDAEGGLVANAPHMPVHLGSMGDCVTAIMRKHPAMRDGDAFVTNAPYDGGTHLPDVTVVMPVFVDGECALFVASRGHHADIGGITPGSMPPFSKDIAEEGILFDGIRMVHATAHFDDAAVRAVLGSGAWPARNPEQNIADLKAQAASCAKGAQELKRICAQHGRAVVDAYMRHVQDNAEEEVRRVIGALKDGAFEMPMDGGMKIRVAVTVDRAARSARIDFTGTSPQQPNNFNAPGSVTKAAVLYVFRCLVESDIPMNAGCLKPLDILVPDGSLLKPHPPGAVAAGNVETSQAVVDALFGALGVLAASQGTMNNLTFGNDRHQYYETICGGAGAGAGFDGRSAVHTHMTNSRLTDPEVLETRYPVRVEQFGIRNGSGGDGRASRRRRRCATHPLPGENDSSDSFHASRDRAVRTGRRRRWRERRYHGHPREWRAQKCCAGSDETEVEAGDAIEIQTPGGGGFARIECEEGHPEKFGFAIPACCAQSRCDGEQNRFDRCSAADLQNCTEHSFFAANKTHFSCHRTRSIWKNAAPA